MLFAGILCAVLGLGMLRSSASAAIVNLAAGAMLAFLGWWHSREGTAAQSLNMALDRITRGYLAEAEAILDAHPPARLSGQLRRASELQRALIAMHRDDGAGCVEHATRAIGPPYGIASRPRQRVQEVSARALRAIAHAARGNAPAALDDAAQVRSSPDAHSEALARAAVAEAIVLSRDDKRDALAAHLARHRKLLLEHAPRASARSFEP